MAKYKDLLEREIELGDLVAITSSYDGSLYVHIVAGFSDKGISALTYYHFDELAGGMKFLKRSLKRAKKGNKLCAGWSTSGWDGFWNISRRLLKLNPEEIFDEEEMKIYNQIKEILNGEERAEVEGVHL